MLEVVRGSDIVVVRYQIAETSSSQHMVAVVGVEMAPVITNQVVPVLLLFVIKLVNNLKT